MIRKIISRSFRIRESFGKPFITELELAEYKKLYKESRKKNHELFWHIQGIAENKFIDEHNQIQKEKKERDDNKLRANIIKTSYLDFQNMKKMTDKNKIHLNNLKKKYLQELARKKNRKRVIQILNEESKTWLSNSDNREATSERLIPDIYYKQSDYFLKLQEKAMLAEQGDYEAFDEYQVENTVIDFKNSILMPIFFKIKGIMKKLKKNEIALIFEEYELAKKGLKKSLSPEDFKIEITELKSNYNKLISKIRVDMEIPKNQIKILKEKLLLIFNLLKYWNEYIEILKMSNEEIKQYQENIKNFPIGQEEDTSFDEKTMIDLLKKNNIKNMDDGHETMTDYENIFQAIKEDESEDDNSELELNSEKLDNFDQEFEMNLEQDKDIYGEDKKPRLANILKGIDNYKGFDFKNSLDYSIIDDIKNDFFFKNLKIPGNENNNVFVDLLVDHLNNLKNEESLSRKEKNGIKDLLYLSEKLSFFKIKDTILFQKLLNII